MLDRADDRRSRASRRTRVIYAISLLVVVSAVQGWLLWRLVRSLGSLGRMEERISRCTQGMALLVDTTETGFTALNNELGRMGSMPRRQAPARVTTKRIITAASRGQSIPEIAATTGVSEGEARLRMLLRSATTASAIHEDHHDSMRA
jgi:hypothetical protein